MTRLFSPASWLGLASLAVLPLAADAFELPHQLVLVVGLVVLAFARPPSASREFLLVGGAWLALLAVATLSSRAPALSLPSLVTFAACVALGAFAKGDERWTPVLWSAWPIAAWGLVQGLGRDPLAWSNAATWCGGLRPFSTLGHPTQLGVWMALVTVLALEASRTAGTKRAKWFAWASGAVAALTCVATLSRAGWLALGVGVATWWALHPAREGKSLSLRALALVGAAVAGLATVIAGPSALAERLTHALVAPTRVQLWTSALHGFAVHPWFGWGAGTFLLVDQQYRQPDAWRLEWGTTAAHAHSFPAEVLATLGLFGAVVVLALVVRVVRAWRQRPSPLIAVPVALAASSLVSFAGVLVLALGWTALAVTLAAPGEDRARRPSTLAVLVALSLAAVTSLQLGASLSLGLAARATQPADAERWFAAAPALDPWATEGLVLHGAWLEQQGRWAEARARYEAAAARVPELAPSEANVGRVAARLGDRDGSHAWFERARRHAPLDARIALDAAESAVRLGELELADGTLTQVLGAYPTDGPAWLLLAQVRLTQQRGVEARAALEAAVAGDWRDWPEGYAVAHALLPMVQAGLGDPALAAQSQQRAPAWTAPGDICGAPSVLARTLGLR